MAWALAPGVAGAQATAEGDAQAGVERDAQAILSLCAATATHDCVTPPLLRAVDSSGAAHSMAVLEELIRRHPPLGADAHGLAHAIGIRAYDTPATLSRVFASCPPTHISGCYHGVMQAYFLDLRKSGATLGDGLLDSLCADHRSASGLYYQCVHGVGHGLMALHDNNLPAALRSCDLLSARGDVENCHAGAFMENIIVAIHPHHSALAHASDVRGGARPSSQSADGHAHHGAHASSATTGAGGAGGAAGTAATAAGWAALDSTDQQYPCSVVEPRYQAGCYDMQSSAMLFHNQGDVAMTAAACERAPGEFVGPCLRSLGRDVFALYAGDHAAGAGRCAALGGTRELHCLAGMAQTVVNVRATGADGMRFCDGVSGGTQKSACYTAVAEMLFAFGVPAADRARLCAGVAAEYRLDCAAAAGVPFSESPR